MNNRHVRTCTDCEIVRIGIHNLFVMTQKITYCLVSSRYDSETGAFVDTWHKDKLYDLSSKDDLKALAVASVNLLAQGFKLSLKTYVERESLTFDAKALGIQ